MTQQQEYQLQLSITDYLRAKYPRVQFRSDMAGVRLTVKPAGEMKRIQKSRGWPDLGIYKMVGGYGGLFLELKVSRDDVFTRAGDRLISGDKCTHILEQCAILTELERQGYAVGLCYGYDEAADAIDAYVVGEYETTDSYQAFQIREAVGYATEEQWRKAQVNSQVDLSVLEGLKYR